MDPAGLFVYLLVGLLFPACLGYGDVEVGAHPCRFFALLFPEPNQIAIYCRMQVEPTRDTIRNLMKSAPEHSDRVTPRPVSELTSNKGDEHWGYTGENGVDHWAEMYPTCGGQSQSPVNIELSALVKNRSLTPFTFTNFDVVEGISLMIQNNGHSAQVNYETGDLVVSDGGLGGEYKVAQFHFHWGENDTIGSEHTVDGVPFPMEMHVVMYNTKYGDMDSAAVKEDGLAVLGAFFQVHRKDNPEFSDLIKALGAITTAGDQVSLPAMPLAALLPKTNHFVRYSGSLTTPPCSEVVTWTLFRHPVPISSAQLAQFRALKFSDGEPLVNNFRPTQPLNGRQIQSTFKHRGTIIQQPSSENTGITID